MSTSVSTVIKKSPRKIRLIIDHIRGKDLASSLLLLKTMNKEQTKKVHDLLLSAASNLKITSDDFSNYLISSIVAEEAQRLYRVVPRARGSAFRVRRRYSRVKAVIVGK
jgi:large subunit ribosomal protein L22